MGPQIASGRPWAAGGYTRFTASVLSENVQMLDVFRHSGFPYRFVPEGDLIRAEIDIRDYPGPPSWLAGATGAAGRKPVTSPPAPTPG